VGLATSSKYTAVLVAVPVILAALLRCTDRAGLRRAVAGLPIAGGCAVLAFLATTPYALLDRPAFLQGLLFERQHYATGHAGMDGDAAGFYAGYLVTHEALLVALALVAVVAVTIWDRQRWRAAVVLGSFPVIYSAVVAMQSVRNDRTIMLVLAPLAVLAALAIEPLLTTCADHHRAVGLAATTIAVAVLVVEAVARLPYPGPSTWNAAQHWLDERTPSGTTVLIEPALCPVAQPGPIQGDFVRTSRRLPTTARGLRGGQRGDVRSLHRTTQDLPRRRGRLPAAIPKVASGRNLRCPYQSGHPHLQGSRRIGASPNQDVAIQPPPRSVSDIPCGR
jgi:hypothetical protein